MYFDLFFSLFLSSWLSLCLSVFFFSHPSSLSFFESLPLSFTGTLWRAPNRTCGHKAPSLFEFELTNCQLRLALQGGAVAMESLGNSET